VASRYLWGMRLATLSPGLSCQVIDGGREVLEMQAQTPLNGGAMGNQIRCGDSWGILTAPSLH
jgi:hypothetical protein